MTQMADILIRNATVLTLDDADRVLPGGGVAVSGDTISAVLSADEISGWTGLHTIDARGGILMPGLVNTHTHAAMTCFRGLADDLPLMTWLNEHIFPAEAGLDDTMVYQGSMLACAEMILSGTTTFCDMYLFERAVARAADESGMRAVVGEVLYNFPSPCYGPMENGFRYTEELIREWALHPRVEIAVEPHSPYLCSPDLLEQAADLAARHGSLLVIHLSETEAEVAQVKEAYGKTPVGLLADIGVLSAGLLAAHCVVLTPVDLSLLHAHDVKVAHNPASNMKLASGVAPVPSMMEMGICVGLGTDGCASNNNLDMFREMDMTAKLHKVISGDPTVMNAKQVVRMATRDGARALGLGQVTGQLAAGFQADMIIVDTDRPHLCPMYNPWSHLVYAASGSDVVLTMIAGRVVMHDRVVRTFDAEKAMADVAAIAKRIRP